jgi:hypothetical protein
MTDFTRSFEIRIAAPVHTVSEDCRDPRRIFVGDPKVDVSDVTLTPEGVGTTAHIVGRGLVTEDVRYECVEFVPDQRIVFKAHPTVTLAGRTKEITHGPSWIWAFVPEANGTRLTLTFLEEDAAWWQRAFDVMTEKGWSGQIRAWLAGIKAGAEKEAIAAR